MCKGSEQTFLQRYASGWRAWEENLHIVSHQGNGSESAMRHTPHQGGSLSSQLHRFMSEHWWGRGEIRTHTLLGTWRNEAQTGRSCNSNPSYVSNDRHFSKIHMRKSYNPEGGGVKRRENDAIMRIEPSWVVLVTLLKKPQRQMGGLVVKVWLRHLHPTSHCLGSIPSSSFLPV